mgnify:CR=1 FL=1
MCYQLRRPTRHRCCWTSGSPRTICWGHHPCVLCKGALHDASVRCTVACSWSCSCCVCTRLLYRGKHSSPHVQRSHRTERSRSCTKVSDFSAKSFPISRSRSMESWMLHRSSSTSVAHILASASVSAGHHFHPQPWSGAPLPPSLHTHIYIYIYTINGKGEFLNGSGHLRTGWPPGRRTLPQTDPCPCETGTPAIPPESPVGGNKHR